MLKKTLQSDAMLFVAALIWGSGFVAQRKGMDFIGPMTFTGLRFLLGSVVILPVLLYQWQSKVSLKPVSIRLWYLAPLAGVALYAGAGLQQIGLVTTTAAKGGFITGIYIAIVPVISIILRHKIPLSTWVGFIAAFVGVYFLAAEEEMTFHKGDLLVLAGSVFWAIHVQLVGHLATRMNPWLLAFVQFMTCAVIALITAAFTETEMITVERIKDAAIPVFYGGAFSVGIAFTLMALSMQTAPPSHAAILMSLEMPFAAIAGIYFLDETLENREIIGCVLMLAGVLFVQLVNIKRNFPKQQL